YIATDTKIIYQDTGTAWQKVGAVKWGDLEDKPASFTPSPHKSTHASGGTDVLTPADIGAANTTTADMTLYVDAVNGNDNNPGTQTQPLQTIQAAVNKIPAIVKHTVTINIAAGTYSENVIIKGIFGSGAINILGGSDLTSAANYIVNRIDVNHCTANIYIKGFTIKLPAGSWIGGINIVNSSKVQVTYCNINGQNFTDANRAGLICSFGKCVINNCDISNVTSSGNYAGAIVSSSCGQVNSWSNTGSNNTYGLNARAGIIHREDTTQPGATTATVTSGGGVIY
ncbi:hypothetical protein ULO1_07340, partial [Carboxydocella sp. ULO1]